MATHTYFLMRDHAGFAWWLRCPRRIVQDERLKWLAWLSALGLTVLRKATRGEARELRERAWDRATDAHEWGEGVERRMGVRCESA